VIRGLVGDGKLLSGTRAQDYRDDGEETLFSATHRW
jgi:hypothetical protein